MTDPTPAPATADSFDDRAGYDPAFLGLPVPLPVLRDDAVETALLPYTHFSILMRLDKRLAAVAALGIDGATLRDVDRSGIDWRLDPRLTEDQQTGERVYARNDIDRGHLVRRAAAVWGGTRAEASQANVDTFHYTNSAPQAADFNQGMELWLGLENYLLDNAAQNERRLVVLTGPVFGDLDPVYRGVEIPLRYFKVAAFIDDGALAATAYVLDQTPQLAELPDVPRPGAADEAPPLGPFRTFQVPVADVAELTGLDLGPVVAADRLPAGTPAVRAEVVRAETGWAELAALADIQL